MLSGVNEDLAFPLLQRRPEITPISEPLPSIAGKRVMVTGAGGSIGAELVRQIATMGPSHLTLVELSELNLYEINATLAEAKVKFPVSPMIADVRHGYVMASVFDHAKPDIVFHAAALKHVPLLENDHNLLEAARTNIGGTYTVAKACCVWGSHMILVSTDKAVKPSSVMGLTKRVAELALSALAHRPNSFGLSIVRFGNVLGSSGSFVPLFRRQIAQGGPVTVTHPDMRRFLMTIREAVSLVLSVSPGARPLPGHRLEPWLYVLEMGKQVYIEQVARQLIEQAGLRPGIDIAIEYTGVRPGEKLEEELYYPHENLIRQVLQGISGCPIPRLGLGTLDAIQDLLRSADERDVITVKKSLVELVPTYSGVGVWK